jgi:CRISPR/Cas system-associated protein endoribonuclease Cas2
MKIKLPLTEKFLWDLYKLFNKAENLMEQIFPETSSIRYLNKRMFYGYCKDAWEEKHRKEKEKIQFSRMVQRLKQNGYLRTLRIKGKKAIIMTLKGMEKLFKTELKIMKKKKRKDKKWQMILFDIPETKRKQRNYFRKALQYLGYKRLQKSIWVCPYDTLKETEELIKRYNIKPFVELLLIEKVGLG